MITLIIIFLFLVLFFCLRQSNQKSAKNSTPSVEIRAPSDFSRHPYKAEKTDNWEGTFWEVEEPHPVKASLLLDYVDGKGQRSERNVDVRQFGAYGPTTLIIGHCRLREETRTFRADRIKSCVDIETGEIVADATAYLKQKYKSSPEYSLNKLHESEFDALRILFYVGKADGQLRAAEKHVIRETCRALSKDDRITDSLIDDLFTSFELPSIHAFKLAVGRLSKRGADVKNSILVAAEKIVSTQKAVHPAEKEALEYMHKRLGHVA